MSQHVTFIHAPDGDIMMNQGSGALHGGIMVSTSTRAGMRWKSANVVLRCSPELATRSRWMRH
eukprot:2227691-Lingulodinium_polyedra.AAC.1